MKKLKYLKDGEYVDLYKVYTSESESIDPFNGYDYVDMGEAGIWATCNVGASSPEESGDYFAWGETEPKESYTWDNYKFGTQNNITKYNSTDGLTTLELEDDAAHVNMGGSWRMPTVDEFIQLKQLCNTQWISNYEGTGVSGRIFKLKTDESKQVFFPAAGYWMESLNGNIGSICDVWSSSLYNKYSNGYILDSGTWSLDVERSSLRSNGISVRGFIPKSE